MTRIDTRAARLKRHLRVRGKVKGTAERPRLSVFRSLNHVYAQAIDDATGRTLASASTLDPELRGGLDGKRKTAQAETVGSLLAQRVLSLGIQQVTFDRGGCRYHGRVKAVAEAARKAGLKF